MSTIDAIELHVRTYRSALKSNLEVTVSSLINSHLKMESILHPLGNDPTAVDPSALVYALFRLPPELDRAHLILMGQNPDVFSSAGFPQITSWKPVSSIGRRRTRFYSPRLKTIADFISSISDVDDIVNLAIAYQTEWNKFHTLITAAYPTYTQFRAAVTSLDFLKVIGLTPEDWDNLRESFGPHWRLRLKRVYLRARNIRLRLLGGSWIDYTKTVQHWWKNISLATTPKLHLSNEHIYFVSSNNHSLLNLITGFPLRLKTDLLALVKTDYPDLWQSYQKILSKDLFLSGNDFLYYVFKNYAQVPRFQLDFQKLQEKLGILTIPNPLYLDIDTQIFPISTLTQSTHLDSRLKIRKPEKLKKSRALIFNIDYPLGFAAYHILSEVMENVDEVLGLYVLGKAAVLNSELGDLTVPRVVFDEHTQNTYMFNNCFNSFFPFLNNQGSILTNQKAVSVLGTFLENDALLQKYLENNLTCIEMESGPYLSAVTEATYDQQLPHDTIIDLNTAPFEVGIINYTSDTPFSTRRTLGEGFLGLTGVGSVYLGSLAILQRIIKLEEDF